MKTKKELNGQKKEEKTLNTRFTELSEDALDLVIGGVSAEGILERLRKLSGGIKSSPRRSIRPGIRSVTESERLTIKSQVPK